MEKLGLIILLISIHACHASHFRGGTISWKPLGGHKVEFKFKMGWTYGRGPGCTETTIGQLMQNNFVGDKVWKCVNGCATKLSKTPSVGLAYYYCTAADKTENWEQGENTFEFTFSGNGPFIVSYTGAMWMSLSVPFSARDGAWNLQTIVNLEQRSDTGLPNASPVTASKPFYRLQFDCKHEIQLPMIDPDGDTLKCRWAVGKECDSICNGVPVSTLDEDTCTLKFNADNVNFKDDGWYGVALTIEDFPRTPITVGNTPYNGTTPLTQVPLQFIIHVVQKPIDCDWKPVFVQPTPTKGSHLTVAAGASIHAKMYASNIRNPTANVTDISLTSPKGMTYAGPFPDPTRPGVVYWDLKWTPTELQKGDNILCGMAEDSSGQLSDTHCFTFIAWDHDPCTSGPCHNNGTCSRRGSTQNYDCICPGYTGQFCDTEIDECSSNPCQHEGTCTDYINAFQCSCKAGYKGNVCQINIEDCRSQPCQNQGTCVDGVNSYTCICSAGYTGVQCLIEIDECTSNPCQHSGTCRDTINGYTCVCGPGYSGLNCETDINECFSYPCQHDGSCQDHVNGYTCVCKHGYTGIHCETDIDECASVPCQNSGTCTDYIDIYVCKCIPGFQGDSCETNIDECLSNPCSNGGTCKDHINGYDCSCLPGYTGRDCLVTNTSHSQYINRYPVSNGTSWSCPSGIMCLNIGLFVGITAVIIVVIVAVTICVHRFCMSKKDTPNKVDIMSNVKQIRK